MLLTRYLVCGFGVLALCLFWVIWGRIAIRVYFLWHGKTLLAFQREGLKRRSRTPLRTSTLSRPSMQSLGRWEVVLAGTMGWSLLASPWRRRACWVCWVCVGRGLVVRSSPPSLTGIIRSSQCHCSKTELFYGESLLPCCLHLHLHLHKRIFIFPLTGRQNCTRLKPAHWLKWQLSKVIWF